ncbi:hypothetical protein Tco_0156124 [Tanacetum coccineum]
MYIMTSRPRTRVSVQAPFGGVTDWYPEPSSISVEIPVAPKVRAVAVASPVGVLGMKRIFKKRTKKQAKTNKTEHVNEKSVSKSQNPKSNRSQSQSKSKSQHESQPRQSQVKDLQLQGLKLPSF